MKRVQIIILEDGMGFMQNLPGTEVFSCLQEILFKYIIHAWGICTCNLRITGQFS